MNRTEKQAKKLARKARSEAVTAACADEMARFNAAVRNGAVARLTTHCGTYDVAMVRADWFYITPKANAGFGFSWAGCNDGVWADLMRQAGVTRNPLFAK